MSSIGQPLNFSDTTPAAPSGSVNVKWQADAPGSPPTPRNESAYITFAYDLTIYFGSLQTAVNQEIFRQNVRHTIIFPGNFSGSGGSTKTAATSSSTWNVNKNGSSIGTIVWAGAGTTPTFTTTSGAAQTLSSGDILTITGPATADGTLANWGVTLVATRS